MAVILALSLGLSGCSVARQSPASALNFSDFPDEMPRRIVTDLSRDARADLRDGLRMIDRELPDVCTARELSAIRESFVIFAWLTTSTKPDARVQAYVEARTPVLQRARETLTPACAARLTTLTDGIRDTERL